jgi:hypothetical protein
LRKSFINSLYFKDKVLKKNISKKNTIDGGHGMKTIHKFILLIAIFFVLNSLFVSAGNYWWDYDWKNRKAINILGGDTDLEDFSVFIPIEKKFAMQPNYTDLRFVDETQTLLDCELEYADSSNAYVWCRIPLLKTSGNEIYMYYNNSNVNSYWNSEETWADHWKGVYHFAESSGDCIDSTSNNNDGTPGGNPGYLNTSTFGKSVSLDGNDYFNEVIDLVNSGVITTSVWVRTTRDANAGMTLIGYDQPGGNTYDTQFKINGEWPPNINQNDKSWAQIGGEQSQSVFGSEIVNDGDWHNIVFILIPGNQARLYVDGQLDDSSTVTNGVWRQGPLKFGVRSSALEEFYYGDMDEWKFSNKNLNESWIKREYQNSDVNSINFGDEEIYTNQILPDLKITEIYSYPEVPEVGETTYVDLTITNVGINSSGEFGWRYNFDNKDNSITGKSSGLEPGESLNLTLSHEYYLGGFYEFYFEVDPTNKVEELDEDNNIETLNIFINGTPDLTPELVYYEQNPQNPMVFTFLIDVHNIGNLFAEDISATIDFGDNTGGGYLIEKLDPNDTYGFVIKHKFQDYGNYQINFEVDPENKIFELDEFNNFGSVNISIENPYTSEIFIVGEPHINETMYFILSDYDNPLKEYKLLASFDTTPPIKLSDGREIPLKYDKVFRRMQDNSSQYGFVNAEGFLNSTGTGIVRWDIPHDNNLIGREVYFSFVTMNNSLPMPESILSISEALEVTLLP